MDKLGVESIRAVVVAVAECGNVVSKLLDKQGIFVLLGLREPIAVIVATNWPQVLTEVKDMDKEERVSLEASLSGAFKPVKSSVDAALDDFLAMGEKTAAVIEKSITDGKDAFESVKELVAEWKTFLGVA